MMSPSTANLPQTFVSVAGSASGRPASCATTNGGTGAPMLLASHAAGQRPRRCWQRVSATTTPQPSPLLLLFLQEIISGRGRTLAEILGWRRPGERKNSAAAGIPAIGVIVGNRSSLVCDEIRISIIISQHRCVSTRQYVFSIPSPILHREHQSPQGCERDCEIVCSFSVSDSPSCG
jgi:hypothetical protein